jgi:hypothetical protein
MKLKTLIRRSLIVPLILLPGFFLFSWDIYEQAFNWVRGIKFVAYAVIFVITIVCWTVGIMWAAGFLGGDE